MIQPATILAFEGDFLGTLPPMTAITFPPRIALGVYRKWPSERSTNRMRPPEGGPLSFTSPR